MNSFRPEVGLLLDCARTCLDGNDGAGSKAWSRKKSIGRICYVSARPQSDAASLSNFEFDMSGRGAEKPYRNSENIFTPTRDATYF